MTLRWFPTLLLALAACVAAPQTPSAAPVVAGPDAAGAGHGERLAQAYCASCHAIGAAGDSAHADAPPFRTLAKRYPVEGLAEALAEGIVVGHPDMPEFRFEPDEVDALIEYLKAIQDPQMG